MRHALALALGILLGAAGCVSKEPVEDIAKRAVAVLELTDGGTCSGTMIAPSVLLTASHCLEGTDLLTVNTTPVNVLKVEHDGADHARVTVDHAFPHWAPMGSEPAQRDRVFMYGNPAGRRDLYREGVIAGSDGKTIYVDIEVGHGDSGAGVFNERGEVVGVITGYGQHYAFVIAIVLPFAFSDAP
jgi:hypothetical protein